MDSAGTPAQVLDGIRVLDCSIAMAGPFAAQRLGDLGADVIKIEPVGGEWHRGVAAGNATGNRINASFLSLNRNKRSLAVDLKSEAGRDIVYRLIDSADVFLQNYRPGVAERLGVDYAKLSRPQSATHLRLDLRLWRGWTIPSSARSGPAAAGDERRHDEHGPRAGPPDTRGPVSRRRSHRLQRVRGGARVRCSTASAPARASGCDVNMLDAIVSLQMQELSVFTVGHKPQRRTAQPHGHVYIRAPYGVYRTRDGVWIVLSLSSLKTLSEILGVPEFLAMDEATAGHDQRDLVFELTERAILKQDAAPLLEAFDRLGVWAGRVYGYQDLVDDPQVRHNGSFVEYDHPTEGHVKTPGFPIRFASTPSRVNRGAPLEGQHTREILGEAGFDAETISRLLVERIVSEIPV